MQFRLRLAEKPAVFSAFSASLSLEPRLCRRRDTHRHAAATQLQRLGRREVANQLKPPAADPQPPLILDELDLVDVAPGQLPPDLQKLPVQPRQRLVNL